LRHSHELGRRWRHRDRAGGRAERRRRLPERFCRTNQTNSIIARDENGSMRLIHGWKGEEGSKLKQSSRFDGIPNQASVP
jgi:hypothetical protein